MFVLTCPFHWRDPFGCPILVGLIPKQIAVCVGPSVGRSVCINSQFCPSLPSLCAAVPRRRRRRLLCPSERRKFAENAKAFLTLTLSLSPTHKSNGVSEIAENAPCLAFRTPRLPCPGFTRRHQSGNHSRRSAISEYHFDLYMSAMLWMFSSFIHHS